MQDVQVEGAKPNILVDLDRTLAFHGNDFDVDHVGEPIQPMIDRIKNLIKHGFEVRIFTARWCDVPNRPRMKQIIDAWTTKQFGQALKITNEKDYGTIAIYDDRAIQVQPNTGAILGRDYISLKLFIDSQKK